MTDRPQEYYCPKCQEWVRPKHTTTKLGNWVAIYFYCQKCRTQVAKELRRLKGMK